MNTSSRCVSSVQVPANHGPSNGKRRKGVEPREPACQRLRTVNSSKFGCDGAWLLLLAMAAVSSMIHRLWVEEENKMNPWRLGGWIGEAVQKGTDQA